LPVPHHSTIQATTPQSVALLDFTVQAAVLGSVDAMSVDSYRTVAVRNSTLVGHAGLSYIHRNFMLVGNTLTLASDGSFGFASNYDGYWGGMTIMRGNSIAAWGRRDMDALQVCGTASNMVLTENNIR
jgi:hypothetical protein